MIVVGIRKYGRIDNPDGTYDMTRFFHLWFLPLFPVGAVTVTGLDEQGSELGHTRSARPSSIVAGYFKAWAIPLAVGLAALGWLELEDTASELGFVLYGIAAALIFFAAPAWIWWGRSGPGARKIAAPIVAALALAALGYVYTLGMEERERRSRYDIEAFLRAQGVPSYAMPPSFP